MEHKMNFDTTRQLLDSLSDLVDIRKVTLRTEGCKDWKGQPYTSDYVTIEEEHRIGFEVFENEIIAYYFADHCHFEDYTSADPGEEPTYVTRAIEFFRQFFTLPLQCVEKRRGNTVVRSEWFRQLPDGKKISCGGPCYAHFLANLFGRKSTSVTMWKYVKDLGKFVSIPDDTIDVLYYDWDILIYIRKVDNAYSYQIERFFVDEGSGECYWLDIESKQVSFFDSAESAKKAAKEEAKRYCHDNPVR